MKKKMKSEMRDRVVVDVLPDGNEGGWVVSLRTPREWFATKKSAVEHAKYLAKIHERSQVVVRTRDGRIQTEYTYGEDPYPPKG